MAAMADATEATYTLQHGDKCVTVKGDTTVTVGCDDLGPPYSRYVSREHVRLCVDGGALHVEIIGQNASGILCHADDPSWKKLKPTEQATLHDGGQLALDYRNRETTVFTVSRSVPAEGGAQTQRAAKRSRPAEGWQPTKVSIIAVVQEMRNLANMQETAGRRESKVFWLGGLLKILEEKLPDGIVVAEDIDDLIKCRGVKRYTVDRMQQVRETGECDYLIALRLRECA